MSRPLLFCMILGRRISLVSGEDRELQFLFQSISVAIQRFNSVLLHDGFLVFQPPGLVLLQSLIFFIISFPSSGIYLPRLIIIIIIKPCQPGASSGLNCGWTTSRAPKGGLDRSGVKLQTWPPTPHPHRKTHWICVNLSNTSVKSWVGMSTPVHPWRRPWCEPEHCTKQSHSRITSLYTWRNGASHSFIHSFIHLLRITSTNKNLCVRDGRTICGPCRKVHVCHCNSLGDAR